MQLLSPINAKDYNPEQGAGSFPIGKHKVIISEAKITATKSNDGGMLIFTLQCIEGDCQGLSAPYRLNLYNQSQTAVEIAHRQFTAVCYVVGIPDFNGIDLRPLFNRPFYVEVGQQATNPQYTEIKKVYDVNGQEPKRSGAAGAQQQVDNRQAGMQAPPQNAFTPPVEQQQQQTPPAAAWGQQTAPNASQPVPGVPMPGQVPQGNSAPPAQNVPWGQQQQQQTPPSAPQNGFQQQQPSAPVQNVPWGQPQQ